VLYNKLATRQFLAHAIFVVASELLRCGYGTTRIPLSTKGYGFVMSQNQHVGSLSYHLIVAASFLSPRLNSRLVLFASDLQIFRSLVFLFPFYSNTCLCKYHGIPFIQCNALFAASIYATFRFVFLIVAQKLSTTGIRVVLY